ncbi:MAG: PAS domain S-box protein [Ramlibacter sp.]
MGDSNSITPPAAGWPGSGGATSAFNSDADSRELLREALTAGGTAAWYSDLRTRERWWSPEMFLLHGLSAGQRVSEDYLALVHPADRKAVQAAFAQSVQTGSHRVEYRVMWPDGSAHWLEGIGRTTRDTAGTPLSITGVCSLIDARKRDEADLRFLAQASSEFARSTDYEETLRRVANLAVPHFADWCAVDILDDQGELRRVAVAHVDPEKVALAEQLHKRYPPERNAPVGAWQVVRTGLPELVPEIPDELLEQTARDAEHLEIVRSLGLRSYMGLPLAGPERTLGVISFISAGSGRIYGERDLELATALVSRAAVAVQNAILFRALRRSAARQNLLLLLTDTLRAPRPIVDVLHQVSTLLGAHFGVDRVGYGQVDENRDLIEYDVCWTDGSVPPLLGRFPASSFGQQVIDKLRAGETVAMADVREHPLTSDQAAQQTSHEVDTRAVLVVPLVKAGRLRTIVYLNQREAREWSQDDISIMEEVAERTRELIERGRTESALRESEARWRGLFERMTEGFFVAEAIRDGAGRMHDFRFVQVNPAFEKLTGIAVAQAVGRPVTEVIPGMQRQLIDTYARVVDTGESAEFEVMVPALNNRWYEARARFVGPDQFSVMFVEITQRKIAALELARSANRYQTLVESIDEGFAILEMLFDAADQPCDYRFLEVNPAFERQSGLVNAAGRTIREMVPDIEMDYVETYGQVAKTGVPIRFESHARPLHRWFDAFAFRIGEAGQRLVGLLFTDVTSQKMAQMALQERESELREAQRLAAIGSWFYHAAEDRTDASPELLRIFGMSDGQSLPAFAAQRDTVYPAEDWQRLNTAVQEALATGKSYSVDLRANRGDQLIWVIARGSAVRAEDGSIIGLRGTVQDITERKKIEEALREADARKDVFLATLAHELRNPLAPLRNGLAILRKADPAGAASVRARELMDRQLTHMVRLVDDLLDVSRVSQGKVSLKKSLVSLRSVLDLALETSRPLIEAAGHTLAVEQPQEPLLLNVDATRLAQVLSNLLNNAAKYTPSGGRIELAAWLLDESHLKIRVTDNGVGIPPQMLEKVFDLFTQVGGAQDRSQGGLGIGLSLARRLVELHGGSICASSDGRQGSTFIVVLPVVEQPRAHRDDGTPVGGARKTPHRRILVVDDNQDAAETLVMLLQMEGHVVEMVHTGVQAVDAAVQGRPEIIFLDIGLPDLDGYEVAERVRSNPASRDTVLVALTGWGAEEDRQRARAAGFDVHLTKPVTAEDIASTLAGMNV